MFVTNLYTIYQLHCSVGKFESEWCQNFFLHMNKHIQRSGKAAKEYKKVQPITGILNI